ncbi:MAG: ATP-binding protein [Cyanobacteria bacterium J06638_22]
MSSPTRSQRFIEAFQNLDLLPLVEAERIDKFRVNYGQRTLLSLESELLAAPPNGKVIFSGHRGCGKSTLLHRLAGTMREHGKFVVFFSIADMVEMSDVNHINILYSIALQLLSQATRQRIPIPEPPRLLYRTGLLKPKARLTPTNSNKSFRSVLTFLSG